jgi:urease accessory protein
MRHPLTFPCAVAFALVAGPALAHPGDTAAGFAAGVQHPLLGLDHQLAMVALGLWAALRPGRAALAPIASFMMAMAIGSLAIRWAAAPMVGVEPMVVASIIVIGLLVAAAARLPNWAASVIAALFGLAHGAAHGHDGPAGVPLLAYVAGMLLATAGLHAAGFFLGRGIVRMDRPLIARGLGAATALGGFGLALAGLPS